MPSLLGARVDLIHTLLPRLGSLGAIHLPAPLAFGRSRRGFADRQAPIEQGGVAR